MFREILEAAPQETLAKLVLKQDYPRQQNIFHILARGENTDLWDMLTDKLQAYHVNFQFLESSKDSKGKIPAQYFSKALHAAGTPQLLLHNNSTIVAGLSINQVDNNNNNPYLRYENK